MEPGDEKDDQINIQLLDNWELNVNKVVLWTRIFCSDCSKIHVAAVQTMYFVL